MSAYLFVHFREKLTPDGEQVHFGLSRDGFHWQAAGGGHPVLWTYYGSRGARDFAVCRCRHTGRYVIAATDLSLSYGMRGEFQHSWAAVGSRGSRCLSIWESDDLIHFSEQRLVPLGLEEFGCMWAPDITYDRTQDDYVLHWSSSTREDGYSRKAIYCSRTRDFQSFSRPQLLYAEKDCSVIDSAMAEEDGVYYLFVKIDQSPSRIIMLRAPSVTGPFERVTAFDESMAGYTDGLYEAPALLRLDDGRWCLFLDDYSVRGRGQGYVPFMAESLASGRFVRCGAMREDGSVKGDGPFIFPYGFKHGSILPITGEQYENIFRHDWQEDQFEKNG